VIGVAAAERERTGVEEFFELFKTPWEPADPNKRYSVVLTTTGCIDGLDAELFLVYGSGETAVDRALGIVPMPARGPVAVSWGDEVFPVYRQLATFDACGDHSVECNGRRVDYRAQVGARRVLRLGYDLFDEVRHLLTSGQPAPHAATPTLDLHIALLRSLLLASGIPVIDIPPRPHGADFIVCLTHDVDFFGLRRHRFDRTLAGFVARTSLGTMIDLLRRRRPLAEAVRNWTALLKLPLVFLNLANDPWHPFDDYARIEDTSRSTFFVVPFKGRPGVGPDGRVCGRRAVAYGVDDIREDARQAQRRGSEVAVHAIDAWHDADAGAAELGQVTGVTGQATAGVRLHWLFFAAHSPRTLETAGYAYDSSCGYNDAVGYRAGTSQVFRHPDTQALLELPLSIMDSALFFPRRLALDRRQAWQQCRRIVANARRHGGTVVINWHDRSLAPERQWGAFYRRLLAEVGRADAAWFARAGQAVDWFRWRRSVHFKPGSDPSSVRIESAPPCPGMPPARIRIERPAGTAVPRVEELRFDGRDAVTVCV